MRGPAPRSVEPQRYSPINSKSPARTIVEIRLLGVPEIAVDRSSLDKPPPVVLQLLAYLLMNRRNHRSIVCGAFWPEVSETKARRRLNTAVWRLRKYLEPLVCDGAESVLVADGEELALEAADWCWCDVDRFETTVRRGLEHEPDDQATIDQLESAVELYRGDLLEGCYEEWLITDRERLRQTYFTGLEHLAQWHHDHGNLDRAVEFGQRIVTGDPLRESVHRALMRLYLEQGDRPAALRQYARCEAILAEQLDTEPMPETALLAAQIRHPAVALCDLQGRPAPEVLEHLRAALDHSKALTEALSSAIAGLERNEK